MAASGTDAPLPRQNNPDNVYIEGGNLVLKQSAYSAADLAAGNPVQIAEIQSQATDYLHGSFRIKAKIDIDTAAAERGSVAGWFYYHDDTHEVDIEALTWEDPTTIHYTSQPSQANGEAVPGATKAQTLTTPWTSLAEHRFDWTSAGLNFFENSISNFVTTANIPAVVRFLTSSPGL
ncbi:MAG: hypothetical protein M4579_002403 [Chaenotheca gracillima]|nr:MAG: hypothetical protein M4579_002403 [Chaenotheca gracillima]